MTEFGLPVADSLRNLMDRVFIRPDGGNLEYVKPILDGAMALAMEWSKTAVGRQPVPTVIPDPPPGGFPEAGRPIEAILDDVQRLFAGAMCPASPGYLGHMDPLPSIFSVVGDFLAATLNNNMLCEEMSPSFTRLERELVTGICQWFGLGPEAGGVMTSGGTLANLQALAVARNVRLGAYSDGWQGPGRALIFASQSAHTSLEKAAMVLGLGVHAVRRVRADGESRMDVPVLERMIGDAIAAGDRPFAVVATAGTTVTGSIDPLTAIAEVCRRRELWFHVDAAYGGALAVATRRRHLLSGIDQADSVTFNPQKWFYVAKTCAMSLFRRATVLQEAFQILHPYMRGSGMGTNLGELSIQGTRSAEVLKLWLTLQHLGQEGLELLIERSFELAGILTEAVRQRPHLVLAVPPQTGIVCFRPECPGRDHADQDRATSELQQKLMEAGIFVSLPRYQGRLWLKAVLLNPFTDGSVFARMMDIIDRSAGMSGGNHGTVRA